MCAVLDACNGSLRVPWLSPPCSPSWCCGRDPRQRHEPPAACKPMLSGGLEFPCHSYFSALTQAQGACSADFYRFWRESKLLMLCRTPGFKRDRVELPVRTNQAGPRKICLLCSAGAILADPTCDTRPAWASDREVEADGSREQSGRVAEARHSERLVILLIAESKSKALVYAALGHFSCGWYPSLRCCVGVLA